MSTISSLQFAWNNIEGIEVIKLHGLACVY